MWKYVKNIKKYKENMKKYLGICKKYVALGPKSASRHIHLSPHIKALENPELHSMYRLRLLDLKERITERFEVRVIVYSFIPI